MAEAQADSAKPGFLDSFSALKNRDYRMYWFSGLGMTGAQGIQQLALAWLVLDLTDSAGQLGLVIFMQGITMATMALFGGVLVDRYNRKTLLTLSQTFTLLNLLTLAALVLSGVVEVWMLYFYAIGLGAMQAVTMPARNALIRSLVSKELMVNAVALNATQMHSSRIIFPFSAGALIALMGVGATILLSAACSFVGLVLLLMVNAADSASKEQHAVNPVKELVEGIRFTFAHPVIGPVMTLALCIATFGLAFMQLGTGFARQELHFSAATTGAFLMSAGAGSLIGAVIMLVIRVKATKKVFVVSCAGFALSLVALCVNPYSPLAFVFMAGFGLSQSTLSIAAQTIFQTEAPQRLLGRVISLWSLGGGLAAITALPIGFIGDIVGLRIPLGAVAVMLFLSAVAIGLGATPLRWLGNKETLRRHDDALEPEAAAGG